ncbi:MAG: putative sulfate/molybdate transporter [Candidatus Omnitrophota bacterium]|nr:putative sulfate/molybdate transporter [Candidatus Omnitrophota bacterium]
MKFNRNEWAGAFGDIGTDFPLLVGMILASGLDPACVLTVYGVMQVMTGIIYRRPMPVQPLKAVALLVITQKIPADTIYGGGLAIALIMLALTVSGSLSRLARHIPKSVVRGIQLGLGISLALLALKDYLPRDGVIGYVWGGCIFVLILVLLKNRRFPAALAAILLGLVYAFVFKINPAGFSGAVGFHLPVARMPGWGAVGTGFILLALPQIPLSLGNSILATRQLNEDLFPERPLTVNKIGWTYTLMNIVSPLFGGVPVCHGSGGMMGHYTFGARTGGSLLIYGGMYLLLGLLFSQTFAQVIQIFPMPVLAAILFVEALSLMALVRDLSSDRAGLWVACMVGLMACALPYGFIVGMAAGVVVELFFRKNLTSRARDA